LSSDDVTLQRRCDARGNSEGEGVAKAKTRQDRTEVQDMTEARSPRQKILCMLDMQASKQGKSKQASKQRKTKEGSGRNNYLL
jgi:hypothetical protein